MNQEKLEIIILKVLLIYSMSFAFYFIFGCLALGYPLSLDGFYRYRLFIFEQFEKDSVLFLAIFTLTPLLLSLLFYFCFVFKSDDRYQNLYSSMSQEIKKLKSNSEEEKHKQENEFLKKQILSHREIKGEFENLSNELNEVKKIITDLQEVTINYQEKKESEMESVIQAFVKKGKTVSNKNKQQYFRPLR
jgi:hypothetical protein